MSGQAWVLSATVFATLAAAGVALEVRGRQRGLPVACSASQGLAAAMRSGPGRVAVTLWWVWLGVHFLAR